MKKFKNIVPLGSSIAFLIPAIVLAQTEIETKINDLTILFTNQLIPILLLLATVLFLWGVIVYITASGDEEKLKKGRTYIIYGLLGLFAMVAVWGIVKLLVGFFGIENVGIPENVGDI